MTNKQVYEMYKRDATSLVVRGDEIQDGDFVVSLAGDADESWMVIAMTTVTGLGWRYPSETNPYVRAEARWTAENRYKILRKNTENEFGKVSP